MRSSLEIDISHSLVLLIICALYSCRSDLIYELGKIIQLPNNLGNLIYELVFLS